MLVDDNLKEVLMKSDIITIKQLVLVNKNMKLYCNDSTFWKNKFKQDSLPIINDKLNTFSFKEWVKEYEEIYKCKKSSINILLLNKIRSGRRRYNQLPLAIYITYVNHVYSDNSDNSEDVTVTNPNIPYYMLEKKDIEQIEIQYMSDNTYKVWYYITNNTYYAEDGLYDDVLNILCKMWYYSFKDKNIKIR